MSVETVLCFYFYPLCQWKVFKESVMRAVVPTVDVWWCWLGWWGLRLDWGAGSGGSGGGRHNSHEVAGGTIAFLFLMW